MESHVPLWCQTKKILLLINFFSKKIEEASKFSWQPEAIMSDFELAIRQGASLVFPKIQQFGCYFHFKQAIRRWSASNKCHLMINILERGYSQESIQLIEQHVSSLYEQPTQEQFWERWCQMQHDLQNKFVSFLDYFERNWIGSKDLIPRYSWNISYNASNFRFPPELWAFWSHMPTVKWQRNRTNNYVEAHNKAFKDFVKDLLVSIIVLAKNISKLFEFWPKQEQILNFNKIHSRTRKKGNF
jgi:hypothetical protein